MMIARKGFAFTVAALSLGVLGAVSAPRDAAADGIRVMPGPQLLLLGTPVAVECDNPGGHQDVSKTPYLKNNTGATIAKGHQISWKSSDGDHGSVKLESDLKPGASVQALGQAGQGYSCSASFLSSPDLTIKSATLMTQTSASFQIANLDPWIGAGAQVVRVEVMSCSGAQVLATVDTAAFGLAKGESKTMTVQFPAVAGKKYVRISADATAKVLESNEKNNTWDSMDSCLY